jgi:hypothetical protein
MTRARELARLGNENVFTAEDYNSPVEVGINSTNPSSTLDVRGDLKVGTEVQLGTAGIVTAVQFSGNITGVAATFSGDVSIGGTLTYEDVTNIDSVGIVTARAGVNVSGGQLLVGSGVTIGNAGVATFSGTSDIHLLDNVKLNVGDGSDLSIYHDASNSHLHNVTGTLRIRGDSVKINNAGASKNAIVCESDTVTLYYNNSAKLATTNDGTVTTGIATATGLDVADKITHTGDTNTAIRFPIADTVSVETAGSERVRIGAAGIVTSYATHPQIVLEDPDGRAVSFRSASTSNNAALGTDSNHDLIFYTNGYSNERVRINNSGDVKINNTRTTSTKLQVVGGTASGTAYDVAVFAGGQNSTSGSGARIYLSGCENDPIDRGTVIEGLMTDNSNAHSLIFKTSASSAAPTERLRIESSGDVGINTSNPTVKLDISEDGVAFPSAAGSTLLRLRNSGGTATISIDSAANANSVIQFGDTAAASVGTIQYSHTTNHLQFNTNGDGEKMRITSAGSIGINTTSPNRRFTLYQDATTRMNLKSLADSTVGIEFGDPDDENIGYIVYDNTDNSMKFGANAGERVRINQYGMMGLSVTSPDALLSVLAQNSNTPPFVIQNPDADENFTISTYHDSNGLYGTIGANYKLNSGGSAVVDTTDHRTAGIFFDGRNNGYISFETNSAGNQPAERLKITQSGGFSFNNAELVERVKITAGKLSDNTNIDLENGMVHYFTTQETTTSTPNIRVNSSTNLNDVMDTGDVVTVTIITTAAAAGYSAQMTIDSGSRTEEWVGGSAPSAGGSDGLDVYTYTIIKTGNGAYTVLANLTNCSN